MSDWPASMMDYHLWRIKHGFYALLWRLPWKRAALRKAIEREVAKEHAETWDLSPYICRIKWARKLSNMSLVESKRFVDRCYGNSKRETPNA